MGYKASGNFEKNDSRHIFQLSLVQKGNHTTSFIPCHVLLGAPHQDLRDLQPAQGIRKDLRTQVLQRPPCSSRFRSLRQKGRPVSWTPGPGSLSGLQTAKGTRHAVRAEIPAQSGNVFFYEFPFCIFIIPHTAGLEISVCIIIMISVFTCIYYLLCGRRHGRVWAAEITNSTLLSKKQGLISRDVCFVNTIIGISIFPRCQES